MKSNSTLRNWHIVLFLAVILFGPASGFAADVNLAMGNPSQATSDPSQKDNYLMEKPYFALSFNNSTATPNWVSWKLIKSDIGSGKRLGTFRPDTDLPDGFTRVVTRDYDACGFDRGHMCNHEDRSADDAISASTFVLSNIIPQAPNVNRKAWEQLEVYCRNLVTKDNKTLYIVSGPAGAGGTGSNGFKDTIGYKHTVAVPAKCWKVIMVLDQDPDSDPNKVSAATRLIAVIMPNDDTVGEAWAGYRVPVKDVETLTGYKFFDQVPKDIMEPLKEKADSQPVSNSTSHHHSSND